MKTLSQIAKELGVSRAAVSYVYNNKWREQRINESLAARIMEKIKLEGCVPDPLGKQLRTGRTNTIGVLLTDLERYFNLELLGGIQKKLTETDYLMLLGNSYFGKNEYSFFNRMRSRKVDGIIFCPAGKSDRAAESLKTDNSKLVFLDNYIPGFPDIPHVVTDSCAATEMLVRHCVSWGRRKIAWIGGSEKLAVLNDRFQGFLDAMKKWNLNVNEQMITRGRPASEAIEDIFSRGAPDAIIFDTLVYIDAAIDVLKEKNMKTLITGFDRPSLSGSFQEIIGAIPYVKQDTALMGSTAAGILIDMISGNVPEKKEYLVKPEFITPGKGK